MTDTNPNTDVMPYILLSEENVKLIVGVPVVPGKAFDPAAFNEDQDTKRLIETARPVIEMIRQNENEDPLALLSALAPHFDPCAMVTTLHSGGESPEDAVLCVVVSAAEPKKLTVAYDPVRKEFWVADNPTICQYIMQVRGFAPSLVYIPRDIADMMNELGENMPAWIKKAQEICGFTEDEKSYFASLKFEGPALSILVKAMHHIIAPTRRS